MQRYRLQNHYNSKDRNIRVFLSIAFHFVQWSSPFDFWKNMGNRPLCPQDKFQCCDYSVSEYLDSLVRRWYVMFGSGTLPEAVTLHLLGHCLVTSFWNTSCKTFCRTLATASITDFQHLYRSVVVAGYTESTSTVSAAAPIWGADGIEKTFDIV